MHARTALNVLPHSTARAAARTDTHHTLPPLAGNYLDGLVGRAGTSYKKNHGFCLETQKFPDACNRPHFPAVTLRFIRTMNPIRGEECNAG